MTAEVPRPCTARKRRIGEELIDALVEVHAVDWRACGLEGYGKPTGYLDRQLRRFGGLWEHNRTRELPVLDRLTAWLAEHMPESGEATIVHGDYRLGNTMFAPDPPRGSPRSSTGSWRRSATRWPTSATSSPRGRRPTTPRTRCAASAPPRAAPGFPTRERADRPLRGTLGPLDVGRPLVHDARAVEVGGVPGGLVQAPAGGHDRRRVLRPARDRRAGDRASGRGRSPRADPRLRRRPDDRRRSRRSRRSASVEGLPPDAVRDRFRDDPEARALLAELETGALGVASSSRASPRCWASRPRLLARLFGGMAPDAAMLDGVRAMRRAGMPTGLLSNSWGDAPLRPRAPTSCSTPG